MNCRALPRLLWTLLALVTGSSPAAAEIPEPYNSDPTTDRPLAPAEAAARWQMPPGFRTTVFAAEPDVRQPIALAFDSRGRLWVAECYTYAESKKRFDPALRDRILVLSDTDGDGQFDQRTVFLDGLEHLSSVEIGFGGVWALTSPTLIFVPDADGDARPDGPARVLLDGFEWERNHHTMPNGLRWGPDGWLYGRQGIQGVSALGPPGAPADQRAHTNGGIWRYHPVRGTVEMVCHGTTNPWGMDWNEYGEGFFINTVIGHLWQIIPGAHYRRMHGQDLNPHTYEVMEQHADHVHWANSEVWLSVRQGLTDATSAAGGGHAHTGLMFYGGDNWPESWRGKLLTINFHGRRFNVETVTRDEVGSGYTGRHGPDLGFSADPWFRGIDLLYGPDGGVFVADWSDTGECHDNEGVFRQSGRIYKLTYGTPARSVLPEFHRLPAPDLLPLLHHRNEFFPRQARRRLQELAAAGHDLRDVRLRLHDQFARAETTVDRLRALWALHASGGADVAFLQTQLAHPDEYVRTWAVRLVVDDPAPLAAQPEIVQALAERANNEHSAFVRLAIASALQRLPLPQRATVARPLLRRAEDAHDHNLPLMLWYGVEPLGQTDRAALASLGTDCALPLTRRCIARRLTAPTGASDDAVLSPLLAKAAQDPRYALDVLTGMRDALSGQSEATPPRGWNEAGPGLAQSTDPRVRELWRALGVVFGDAAALGTARAVVADARAAREDRRAALKSLIDRRVPDVQQVCTWAITVPELASVAANGLARTDDPKLGDVLLAALPQLSPSDRTAVLGTLLTRVPWAQRVLDAVAEERLPRGELSAFHLRQIRTLNHPELTARLAKVWGPSRDPAADKLAALNRWKSGLAPEVLKHANLGKGRELYQTLCATCHRLNGEGGLIGPELTGSARDNLDYLLQNIIDPSAAVAHDYQLVTVATKDGRSLSGLFGPRSETQIVLKTLTETVSLRPGDIVETKISEQSMMPDGLLDSLTPEQVRNLIGYLMTK